MVFALLPEGKVDGKNTICLDLMKGDDERLIEVEDDTPDGGLYMNEDGRALLSGRRIKLDHVPKQMKGSSKDLIPDFGRSHGLMHVSDKFKAVVEAVEPGVHQFIPFEIVGANRKHIANRWFMVVCNRIDSVDRAHTTLILYRDVFWVSAKGVSSEHWPPSYDPSEPNRLVYSLGQIGGRHIWFDKHAAENSPLVSDLLVHALKAENVSGASFYERRAV